MSSSTEAMPDEKRLCPRARDSDRNERGEEVFACAEGMADLFTNAGG